MRMELKRWKITESRWNRNEVSRESPETELNRRPTSLRKFRADAFSGPWVSMAMGWKIRSGGRVEYLDSFLIIIIIIIIERVKQSRRRRWRSCLGCGDRRDMMWDCRPDSRRMLVVIDSRSRPYIHAVMKREPYISYRRWRYGSIVWYRLDIDSMLSGGCGINPGIFSVVGIILSTLKLNSATVASPLHKHLAVSVVPRFGVRLSHLFKAPSTLATVLKQRSTLWKQHSTFLPKTATMSNEFIVNIVLSTKSKRIEH